MGLGSSSREPGLAAPGANRGARAAAWVAAQLWLAQGVSPTLTSPAGLERQPLTGLNPPGTAGHGTATQV
jgi:hypothetical protein